MDPNVIMNRLVRLAKLDTSVFEEVRDDPRELVPGLIIAAVSILLMAFGTALWAQTLSFHPDNVWVNMFLLGTIFTAALYGGWVVIAYVVLVQMFRAQADLQSMFRTMGYAGLGFAPAVLAFIPIIYPLFLIVPIALVIILSIYAVQCVTDAEPGQVIIANLIGFAVFVLVASLISLSGSGGDAPLGAGVFALIADRP